MKNTFNLGGLKGLDNIQYLILWLTDDCNLRCKYCYGNAGEKQNYMSFQTAKTAMDIPAGKYKLQLAGGEPLMNFHLIRKIYEYIWASKPHMKIQLQTNGTLITHEMAREIRNMGLAIGVSLDGIYPINEKLRGRTKAALNGIRLLGEQGIGVNINCVVSNSNIEYLDKFIDWIFYLGNVNGIGLDLLRNTGRTLVSNVEKASPEHIHDNLWKAYRQTKKIFELTGKKIFIREIEEAKRRMETKVSCDNYCYASIGNAMVVLPGGQLYPCGSLVGKQEYYMGNIHEDESIKKIALKIQKPDQCKECKYNEFCRGACPSRSIINEQGGFTLEDCILRRTAFEIAEKEKSAC